MIDKDFKNDVTTLVKRVLSVSRKLYEEKIPGPDPGNPETKENVKQKDEGRRRGEGK